MKKFIISLALCVSALTATAQFIEDFGSTAGPGQDGRRNGARLAAQASSLPAGTIVKIYPRPTPRLADPTYLVASQVSITAIRDGNVKSLTFVTPYSFMSTTEVPPPAPIVGAGGTVMWWIEGVAPEGQEISPEQLGDVVVKSRHGGLDKVFNFTGLSYAEFAVGLVAPNDQVLISGPMSRKVKRFIVGVFSKAIPVTSANIANAYHGIALYEDWYTSCTVAGVTVKLTLVEPLPPIPRLFASRQVEGAVRLSAETNGYPLGLKLQSARTVIGSEYFDIADMKAGETLVIPKVAVGNIPSSFFRLRKP